MEIADGGHIEGKVNLIDGTPRHVVVAHPDRAVELTETKTGEFLSSALLLVIPTATCLAIQDESRAISSFSVAGVLVRLLVMPTDDLIEKGLELWEKTNHASAAISDAEMNRRLVTARPSLN